MGAFEIIWVDHEVRLYRSRPIVLDGDLIARLIGYRSLRKIRCWFRSVVQNKTKVPDLDKLWCINVWTGAVVVDGYEASVTDWIGSTTHDCTVAAVHQRTIRATDLNPV